MAGLITFEIPWWQSFMRGKKFMDANELEEQVKKVWSIRFLDLMRNRLRMGRLRYGPPREKSNYDLIPAMQGKLDLYKKTGNDELLVDVANYAMLQFTSGTHPTKHFEALDDACHARTKDEYARTK